MRDDIALANPEFLGIQVMRAILRSLESLRDRPAPAVALSPELREAMRAGAKKDE